MSRRLALAVLIGAAVSGPPALAQSGGLPFGDGSGPIEIDVDGGIEWQQKAKTFVARGNARARQDDVTVRADVLTAHYRDSKDGGTEIWRIVAEGSVRITAPDRTATGERGTYDVDEQALVLTGRPAFESGGGRITADDRLEYWQARPARRRTRQRDGEARGPDPESRDADRDIRTRREGRRQDQADRGRRRCDLQHADRGLARRPRGL